jgi:hypothetical protein
MFFRTYMKSAFTFRIHPCGIEEGFELTCEGVLAEPLKVKRLYDAVIYALRLGQELALAAPCMFLEISDLFMKWLPVSIRNLQTA